LLGYSLESNDLVIAVGKFATTWYQIRI
jgi:hypothetical protein